MTPPPIVFPRIFLDGNVIDTRGIPNELNAPMNALIGALIALATRCAIPDTRLTSPLKNDANPFQTSLSTPTADASPRP